MVREHVVGKAKRNLSQPKPLSNLTLCLTCLTEDADSGGGRGVIARDYKVEREHVVGKALLS